MGVSWAVRAAEAAVPQRTFRSEPPHNVFASILRGKLDLLRKTRPEQDGKLKRVVLTYLPRARFSGSYTLACAG